MSSIHPQYAHRRTTATLKDAVSAPSKGTAFSLGQGALAGGAALGLGALAFYGLGLSNEVGAIDKAVAWPEVRLLDNLMRYEIH